MQAIFDHLLVLAKAHISDVEVSVLGSNNDDIPLPTKKQQFIISSSISQAWADFPSVRTSGEIERLMKNFDTLPLQFKTTYICNAMAQGMPQSTNNLADIDLLQSVYDLLVSMFVVETMKGEPSSELAKQIEIKLLALQYRSAGNNNKWYWYDVETRLTQRCIAQWTTVLSRFSTKQATDFLVSIKPLCLPDYLTTASMFCLAVDSALRVQCLFAWYFKATDTLVKRDILEVIVQVLTEKKATQAQQEFDMQCVVDALQQKYPPQDLKPVLRQLDCWFRCNNKDLQWDAFNKEFAGKRILKLVRSYFSTTMELASIAFKGRAVLVKPHLAKFLMNELAERQKKLLDTVDYSNAVSVATCLADLCWFDSKFLPMLLNKTRTRFLIGLLTLRILQSRQLIDTTTLVETIVVPHLTSIDSIPKQRKATAKQKLVVKRVQEDDQFYVHWNQLEDDAEAELTLEVLVCLDLLVNAEIRIPCDFLHPNKFPTAIRRHCLAMLQMQVQCAQFELRIIDDLKQLVVDSKGMGYTSELIEVLRFAPNQPVCQHELAGLALALAAASQNFQLCAELFTLPLLERLDRNEDMVKFIYHKSLFHKECSKILAAWNSDDNNPLVVRILLVCDPARVPVEHTYFAACVQGKRPLDDLNVCSAAGYSSSAMLNLLRRVCMWFRLPLPPTATSILAAGASQPSSSASSSTNLIYPQQSSLSTSSFAVGSTLRTSLRFGGGTPTPLPPSSSSSSSSSSSVRLGNGASTAPSQVSEEFAEEKVLMRVASRVLCMKSPGNEAALVEAAVEALNLLLSKFSNRNGGAARRTLPISTLLITDMCHVVCAVCDLVQQQTTDLVDTLWKRVDRRILWIFLRRVAGFEEQPFLVGAGAVAQDCRDTIEDTAVRLLSVGPVSLGKVCESPDADLFRWILASPRISTQYLAAHFSSLIDFYISRCVAKPQTTGLFPAILTCVREHFKVDFERGIFAALGQHETLTLSMRVHFLAMALMMPSLSKVVHERQLGDFICIALCPATVVEDKDESVSVLFAELSRIFTNAEAAAQEDKMVFVSRWCAKYCACADQLAQPLVELMWQRDMVELSLPWVARLKHGVLFDRAWELPFSVWRSFPNKLAAMRYIVSKQSVDQRKRQQLLLAQVASVATCPDFLIVFNENLHHEKGFAELVCEALVVKGLELLRYCAFDSYTDFCHLGNFAFAGKRNRFTQEYLRWVNTLDSSKHVVDNDQQELDWVVSVLCRNVSDTAMSEWLSDVLHKLDCADDAQQHLQPLLRLYCALKLNGVVSPQQDNELALIIAASHKVSAFESLYAYIEYTTTPMRDQEEQVVLLDAVLRYLSEIWCAVPLVFNRALELCAIRLFAQVPTSSSLHEEEDDEGKYVRLFWIAFERLVRLNLDHVPNFPEGQELRELMYLLAEGNEDLLSAMRVFQQRGEDCGETALLVCFQVAKETQHDDLLALVFDSASAREEVAHICAKEVILSTYAYSPRLINSAALLLQQYPALLSTSSSSDLSMRSLVPFYYYQGPRTRQVSLDKADQMWAMFSTQFKQAYGKEEENVVLNNIGYENGDSAVLLLTQPQPTFAATNNSEEDVPSKRHIPVDLRDALTGGSRARILAHAQDRGYDPAWLDLFEKSSYVPGLEAEQESLWQSFQRSRWWVFPPQ